jgi:hypothetical protein
MTRKLLAPMPDVTAMIARVPRAMADRVDHHR